MTDFNRGLKTALGALAAIGVAALLFVARSVVLLVFLAIIVAQALSPAVERLKKKGFSPSLALTTVYASALTLLGLLSWRVELALGTDLSSGFASLSQLQTQLQTTANRSSPAIRGLLEGLSGFLRRVILLPTPTPRAEFAEVRLFFTFGFAVLAIVIFSAYWLTERAAIKAFVLRLVSESRRGPLSALWDDIEAQFGAWTRAEMLLMTCIAVPFWLTLLGLRLPNPLLLALFAGVVGVVPIVGSLIGPAPAVLVALSSNFSVALLVLVVGLALQVLEGAVIGPRLMKRFTGVSPFIVLLGIVVGGAIAGIEGALVAVPLAAVGQVVLRRAALTV